MSNATEHMTPVALGLGSNLGDRALVLRAAINDLRPYMNITAVSPIYETPPAYVLDQPSFLNAAIIGTTQLSPLALLWSLKYVEGQLGRQPTFRYGPRVIDLDLLMFGNQVLDDPQLIIPHPRMGEREFVLRPLADIAPDWVNRRTGETVATMLAKLPAQAAVRLNETL